MCHRCRHRVHDKLPLQTTTGIADRSMRQLTAEVTGATNSWRIVMVGALEGIHVLDWTEYIGGSLAASLLADMGADVVKLEPLEGEPWRLYKQVAPKESQVFQHRNRGKRSMALDL